MTTIFAAASHSAMSGEGVYNYGLVIFLMMTGLYLVLSKGNMIKSVIGLNLFQVSVIMFYVSMGRVEHGTAPIFLTKTSRIMKRLMVMTTLTTMEVSKHVQTLPLLQRV